MHCGDGRLSRHKGKSQIPTQWFFKANSHETLGISEGFGARGPFFSGTYPLPMAVGMNSLKYGWKKGPH